MRIIAVRVKTPGWIRYLTLGEIDGREMPGVILPRVCQPLRHNDYFYLSKYPLWSPLQNKTVSRIAEAFLSAK